MEHDYILLMRLLSSILCTYKQHNEFIYAHEIYKLNRNIMRFFFHKDIRDENKIWRPKTKTRHEKIQHDIYNLEKTSTA